MINLNAAFEDELYFDYLKNPESVSPEWRKYFEEVHGKSVVPISNYDRNSQDYYHDRGTSRTYSQELISSLTEENGLPESTNTIEIPQKDSQNQQNGDLSLDKTEKEKEEEATPKIIYQEPTKEYIPPRVSDEIYEQLGSIQAKIAENMDESLSVPTATSVRTVPVKALDENRRIINKYLIKLKKRKVSFTHILAWAVVKTLQKFPSLNDTYSYKEGKAYRVVRPTINFGLAVDVTRKDGTRLLMVPSIKDAGSMTFAEFAIKYDEIIDRAKKNKLTLDDLQGTTISLTNPGMIGTASSMPRLMAGQGCIIAAGKIDYPVEFKAVRPTALTNLAISKVVSLTNTYDHRIIQGAQSGEFLSYMDQLLIGDHRFYDQIFYSLKIPFEPIRWEIDTIRNSDATGHTGSTIEKGAHVMQMINAYRVRGHLLASINPLGFDSYYYKELDPAYYGFTIWDLEREFHADDTWEKNNLPLRDIIELLRETYCGSTGIEFMHIQSPEKKDWIKRRVELKNNNSEYSKEEKLHIYKKLLEAVKFEDYLHTKYIGHKRFSLEGGESLIVLLDKLLNEAADNKLHSVVLGMAHRGRLNVLANNIGKSYSKLFNEFDGEIDPTSYQGSGDVKYHLGDKGVFVSKKSNSISVILSPNPSHLELVDPVIVGMARAINNEIEDYTQTKALPILVHGDAAFAGQGIVAETLNLSQLEGYKTGGTIHVIINNQIGFTTTIDAARSTIYATDIAKMIQTPIIHVNGNDPEAVCEAAKFAIDYRNSFGSDVIIDMLCYRKYGHNEADEPTYTQPLLYKKIKQMVNAAELYKNDLIKEGVLDKESADKIENDIIGELNGDFDKRNENYEDRTPSPILKNLQLLNETYTGVDEELIRKITKVITELPANFKANPKVESLLKKRKEMVENDNVGIDWAMAEHLAFGTLLLEGHDVRFTGQDSRRGTFSQRHSVLVDLQNEYEYIPLNHLAENQGRMRIYDSPLSEIACLGFEYGYSVINNRGITLWEAQFGDFTNNAQSIIDQFISCAEMKWGQTSNLVMLLPHSYDGQGPEHSSARLERFLQLCADDNMIVANLTTPAQYFHALRRQVLMNFKLPLILMTPKSLLRHPLAVSDINDLARGSFKSIIPDKSISDIKKVERVLITSGKIYYELLKAREDLRLSKEVPIIRIEQFYPFNDSILKQYINQYTNAKEIFWVQEEPKNQGAWSFLAPQIIDILGVNKHLKYVGRKESAATATGSFSIHIQEQKAILNEAFSNLD